MVRLTEAPRSKILSGSRDPKNNYTTDQHHTRNRIGDRLWSRVKDVKVEDMNKLFKEGIIDVLIVVHGETDNYNVVVSFGSILDKLRKQVDPDKKLDARMTMRAFIAAFNSDDDVRFRCDCPDFRYRQAYWLSKDDMIYGQGENRPSDQTNPNNTAGNGCKHIMLLLSNNTWLIKASQIVTNYVNYMADHYPKLYAEVIYPAIFGQQYQEPYQMDLDTMDTDELDTSEDTLDTANTYAKTKNYFKPGNEYRYQKQENPDVEGQLSFDDIDNAEEEPAEETQTTDEYEE